MAWHRVVRHSVSISLPRFDFARLRARRPSQSEAVWAGSRAVGVQQGGDG